MNISHGIVFVTGFLTSLHCIGMCGTIVLAYSIPSSAAVRSGANPLWLHAAWNGGRIVAYALLGAMAGMIGMAFSWMNSVGEILSVAGGLVMIVGGLAMLGLVPVPAFVTAGSGFTGLHRKLIGAGTVGSKFFLGLLTPLLPCGLLYAILAKAAASGGAFDGALTMGLFAAGTVPALALLGGGASVLSARLRRRAEFVAAGAVVLMGILLVLRGFHVPFAGFLPMGGMVQEHHSCCPE